MKKELIIITAGFLVFGVCAGVFAMEGMDHEQSAQQQVSAPVSAQDVTAPAVDAGNLICPVSGEKIDQKLKSTYEYNGKIYNFCCAMCIDSFKKDPEKYIKIIEEEKKAAVESPTVK